MAFNPKMFKAKKKRAVDPNAPPRPNLMSHDKTIREQKDVILDLQRRIQMQQDELDKLRANYGRMQQSVDGILRYLRKGK